MPPFKDRPDLISFEVTAGVGKGEPAFSQSGPFARIYVHDDEDREAMQRVIAAESYRFIRREQCTDTPWIVPDWAGGADRKPECSS